MSSESETISITQQLCCISRRLCCLITYPLFCLLYLALVFVPYLIFFGRCAFVSTICPLLYREDDVTENGSTVSLVTSASFIFIRKECQGPRDNSSNYTCPDGYVPEFSESSFQPTGKHEASTKL